jgi:hypothetical protein
MAAPLGFSVPCVLPQINFFDNGQFIGKCQVAIRKYRSRDGAASDISPMWPPQDQVVSEYVSTGDVGLQINNEALIDGYSNINGPAGPVQKIACVFQVPENKSSEKSPFSAIRPALRKFGNPGGTAKFQLYDVQNNTSRNSAHAPTTPYDDLYAQVSLSRCPPTGTGNTADFVSETMLNKGQYYALVSEQLPYGQETAETQNYMLWGYLNFQWNLINFEPLKNIVTTDEYLIDVVLGGVNVQIEIPIKRTSSGVSDTRVVFMDRADEDNVLMGGPCGTYRLEARVNKGFFTLDELAEATGIAAVNWTQDANYYLLNKLFRSDVQWYETTNRGSSWAKIKSIENKPNLTGVSNSTMVDTMYSAETPANKYALVWNGTETVDIVRFNGGALDDVIEVAPSVSARAKVRKLAISEDEGDIMYVAIRDLGIRRSLDAGATWATANGSGLAELATTDVTWVSTDPTDLLYAFCTLGDAGAGSGKAYFTNDSGIFWYEYLNLSGTADEEFLCVVPGLDNDLYVGTSKGRILRTDDRENASATWTEMFEFPILQVGDVQSTLNAVQNIVFSTASSGDDDYMYAVVETDFGNTAYYKDYGTTSFSRINRSNNGGTPNYVSPAGYLALAASNTVASRIMIGDSYYSNQLYITDTSPPKFTAYKMESDAWEWLGPYRKLVLQVIAAPTLKRYEQEVLEQRYSTEYFEATEEAPKKLIITNLQDYADDAKYEDYDKIQVCIGSDVFGGEFVVVATLDLNQSEYTINTEDFLVNNKNNQTIQPFTNWPFSGHKQMMELRIGQNQHLVGMGLSKWDNYTDAPRVFHTGVKYLRKQQLVSGRVEWVFGNRVGQSILWTQGLDGVSDPADYDGDGNSLDKMLCTVYRADPTLYGDVLGCQGALDGNRLFTCEVRIESGVLVLGNINGSPIQVTNGIAVGENGSGLRAEFRRKVLGSVEKGSDQVILTYADDGSPALIASEWMVNNAVSINGVQGIGSIVRVDPLIDANPNIPYINMQFFPTNKLTLLAPWAGEDGVGQFSLTGDTNSLFFGGDRADNWESTGPKLRYICNNTIPITAIGMCQGRMVVICEKDQIIDLDFPNGGVFLPTTIQGIIGYDIGQDIQASVPKKYAFTCVGQNSVQNDDMGNLYWAGTNAIYFYNLSSVIMLTTMKVEEFLKGVTPESLRLASMAMEANFAFSPAIRIGGFTRRFGFTDKTNPLVTYKGTATKTDNYRNWNGGEPEGEEITWHQIRQRRNKQLVFLMNTRQFIELEDFGEIHSITSVLCSDGSGRTMAGANGFLWLYALPYSQRSDESNFDHAYTIGRVNQESIYQMTFGSSNESGFVNGESPVVTFPPSMAPYVDYYKYFELAGHLLTVIDPVTGDKVLAEVLFPTAFPEGIINGVSLRIQPIPDTETFVDTEEDYNVILGARNCALTLPSINPGPEFTTVRIDSFIMEIEDGTPNDEFDWPLRWRVFLGKGSAEIDNTVTINRDYRSERGELRFQSRVIHEISRECYVAIDFTAPPTAGLLLKGIMFGVREQGSVS